MSKAAMEILVVDDEIAIRRLLRVGLAAQGYQVLDAENAVAARRMVALHSPELIILDLGLPDSSGQDLLRTWRAEGLATPIVIVSSRTDEVGIVQALESGADDYVTKPFGVQELGARMRVALRHSLQRNGERGVFETGALSIDFVRRVVRMDGAEVRLSPKEYDILRLLAQHAGKVLTHQFILKHVWGGSTDVQYLRVYIRQIRQKIEEIADQPVYITTETGVGYRLREPDMSPSE